MTALARIEVTEIVAGRPSTTVAYFPTDVPSAVADQLRPIVDQAVARLDMHAGDARLLLAGEVAKLHADAEAYEREAGRRGVLAL